MQTMKQLYKLQNAQPLQTRKPGTPDTMVGIVKAPLPGVAEVEFPKTELPTPAAVLWASNPANGPAGAPLLAAVGVLNGNGASDAADAGVEDAAAIAGDENADPSKDGASELPDTAVLVAAAFNKGMPAAPTAVLAS